MMFFIRTGNDRLISIAIEVLLLARTPCAIRAELVGVYDNTEEGPSISQRILLIYHGFPQEKLGEIGDDQRIDNECV